MGEVQEGTKVEQDKKIEDSVAPVATAFVYKVDMHCEGCAKKIKRMVKHFDGVKDVKLDISGNKLNVVGKIDPVKLQVKLEEKTKRKVVLVNPPPPKVEVSVPAAVTSPPPSNTPEAPKESSMDLKIRLHCEGCIQKIKKIILKIEGVHAVVIEEAKDVVTIKGTMDVKELVPFLTKKFKRTVEPLDDGAVEKNKTETAAPEVKKEAPVVAVNEAKKEGNDGEEKKKEAGDGGEKKKEAKDDGEKKKETGDGGKKEESAAAEAVAIVNKMDYYGYSAPMYWEEQEGHMYGQSYLMDGQGYLVAGQSYSGSGYNYVNESYVPYSQPNMNDHGMFSDENPNGCSIM